MRIIPDLSLFQASTVTHGLGRLSSRLGSVSRLAQAVSLFLVLLPHTLSFPLTFISASIVVPWPVGRTFLSLV